MALAIPEFRSRLNELRQQQAQLAELLQSAAAGLSKDGSLPSDLLREQLLQTRETSRQLTEQLQSEGLWAADTDTGGAEPSLTELEQALDQYEHQRAAFAWLEAVQQLRHSSEEQFPPLEICRTEALQLAAMLSGDRVPDDAATDSGEADTSTADASSEEPGRNAELHLSPVEFAASETGQSLIEGTHPLCCLVRLVVAGGELSDDEWTRNSEQITRAWGRTLATAVARDRLCFSGQLPAGLPLAAGPQDTSPASPIVADAAASPESQESPAPSDASADHSAGSREDDSAGETAASAATAGPLRNPVEAEPSAEDLPTDNLPGGNPSGKSSPEKTPPVQKLPESASPGGELPDEELAHAEQDADPVATGGGAVILRGGAAGNRGGRSGESANGSSSLSHSGAGSARRQARSGRSGELFPERHMKLKRTLRELAAETARAQGIPRDGLASLLIWRLVLEDRLSLAYHLSLCLEARDVAGVPFLPSWMIRAVALGTTVRHSAGAVVRQLQRDLAEFSTNRSVVSPAVWNEAVGFLKVAAALKPAVMAPETAASTVLHSRELQPGLSRLRNYCVRAAIFGDRQQKLDPSQFKRQQDETVWRQRTEELAAEIDAWRTRNLQTFIRYEPAPHCYFRSHWSLTPTRSPRPRGGTTEWQQRQEAVNTMDDLLNPVKADSLSGEVIGLMQQRLAAAVDRWLTDESTITGAGSTLGSGSRSSQAAAGIPESIRGMVDQAVTLARSWLNHLDQKPGRRPVPIPRGASDLQDAEVAEQLCREVRERHAAVQEELREYERSSQSLLVAAGTACCCRAIESLRKVFDPDLALPSEELDLRHLLHAELLRLPGIPLNDRWEPELDPETLERAIIEQLADEEHSWEDVFLTQCRTGGHDSATRILSLPVWREEDRTRLEAHLEDCLRESRHQLVHQIEETRQLVAEALRLGVLEEEDHQRLEDQLREVEIGSHDTRRLPRLRAQLQRVQHGIVQLRQTELERVRRRFRLLNRPDRPEGAEAEAGTARNGEVARRSQAPPVLAPPPRRKSPPADKPEEDPTGTKPGAGGWDMHLFSD